MVTSRGRTTLRERVQAENQMLKDSLCHLAHGTPLLDKHGALMSASAIDWLVKLVERRSVLILKTTIVLLMEEANALENRDKSV